MSLFNEMLAASPEAGKAFREGVQPVAAGEYRLIVGEFKVIPERKSMVLKFMIDSKGDGSPSEHDGRAVDLWLNFGSAQGAAIAHDKCRSLGLVEDDFQDDAGGKLPVVLLVRAIVTMKADSNGVNKNDIGKILEIVSREPQATQTDSLEAY